jgi:hypothetical protein
MRARRITALIAGAGLALAAALGTAPASATIHPALANGTYNIIETNGNHAVGYATQNAGEQVTEVTGLGRDVTFVKATTYMGEDAGFLQTSNGNLIAMTTTCGGATLKSLSESFGTVWAAKPTGITHTWWLISRPCDQANGSHNTVALAGRDITGRQFLACGSPPMECGGLLLKMTLAPA